MSFRDGKRIILLEGWDRGNQRWGAKVELFEKIFTEMGMISSKTIADSSNWKETPTSVVEGWLIDTWKAEFERLSGDKLRTIREAGAVQESWDIQELHTIEDLENVEKPIKVASAARRFGI
jgi:hypothetical protein